MELGDCGAACLAMVLGQHGRPARLAELRDLTSTGRDGVSAAGIVQAARHHGLEATGVRCPTERLAELPTGSVLHWGANHFVVLAGRTRRGLRVLDPALGERVVPAETVREQYSGIALTFTPRTALPLPPLSSHRPRGRYRGLLRGSARPLIGALLLAGAVQAGALVYPFVLRRVVERAGDLDGATSSLVAGLVVLSVGFLLAQVGRLLCLTVVQRLVDVRLTLVVLRHLAALPYAFLARRSTGDLALRVRSTFAVRQVLTAGALSAVLDGTLVLGYLGLILAVDPAFAALTLLAVAVQALLVAATWRRLRQAAAEALEAQTGAQTALLEIVGGLELLKAAGSARAAVDQWAVRLRREVDAQVRSSRLSGLVDSALVTVRFSAPPALLVLGLERVQDGTLALADMLALAALSAAVTVPVGGLLSTVCSLTAVLSYVERLDDLLDAQPEPQDGRPPPARLRGEVEFQDVSFRYSALLPPAVAGVSLRVEPGEHVAVVGASGSGKTTLALLLATLYDPEEGVVRIDGEPVRELARDDLRRRIGIVTQDTVLFQASIAENIAFGRDGVTQDDVVAAARLAALHDEVERLPSGYDTRLGNGGAGLSGGQRQRVALARALVGEPGLLVLDEATSALDPVTEQQVHRALASLRCTRVVVAHRLSTVATADRVLVMEGGRVVADGTYDALRRRSEAFRALLEADGRLRPRRA